MSKKKNEAKKYGKKDLKQLNKQLKGMEKIENLALEFYDKLLNTNLRLEAMIKAGEATPAEDIAMIIRLDEIMTLEEKIHKNFEPEKKKGKKNKKNKKGGKKK